MNAGATFKEVMEQRRQQHLAQQLALEVRCFTCMVAQHNDPVNTNNDDPCLLTTITRPRTACALHVSSSVSGSLISICLVCILNAISGTCWPLLQKEELARCTFTPTTHSMPGYIHRMAASHAASAANVPAKAKYNNERFYSTQLEMRNAMGSPCTSPGRTRPDHNLLNRGFSNPMPVW